MFQSSPNLNALWASLIVDECIRCGVTHFVVSPGSRSTPLALSAANHHRANVCVHFDERGAAFHALGIAKASRTPAVFICTSGTAVANAAPAVAEASDCFVPLMLLTADRPPELIDTGANQTIRQTGIFANFVRWQHDLPVPDLSIAPRALLTLVDQAFHRAAHESGPVHINVPFREPLAPTPQTFDGQTWLAPIENWLRSEKPFTSYALQQTKVAEEVLRLLKSAKRGILLVGLLDDALERDHALRIAKRLGWPVFPDPAAGLRFNRGTKIVHHFDAIAASRSELLDAADCILHVGGPMTSKALNTWLGKAAFDRYIRIHPSPRRLDPVQRVTNRVQAATLDLVNALDSFKALEPASSWSDALLNASRSAGKRLDKAFEKDGTLSEQWAVRSAVAIAPKRAAIFLGNSLPIRHADHFAGSNSACRNIFANRGASGIDGNIATAAGIARALNVPIVAIIGDLATLHDLNSLALLADPAVRVTLIVLNNDGGGIFHLLPIADHPERFEQLFGTPHGRKFRQAAKLFGIDYNAPKTREDFDSALQTALQSPRSTLIEVTTNRTQTAQLTRELRSLLSQT